MKRFVILIIVVLALSIPFQALAADYEPLESWYGFEDTMGFVQKLDLPAVTHYGFELQAREVLVESDRVHILMTAASDQITSINSISAGGPDGILAIGDDPYLEENRFDLQMNNWGVNPSGDPASLERDGTTQFVLTAFIPGDRFLDDEIAMSVRLTKINLYTGDEPYAIEYGGPWNFSFTADLRPMHELTRTIPIRDGFVGNGEVFEVTKLESSPVRSRVFLRAMLPDDLSDGFQDVGAQNLIGILVSDGAGNQIELTSDMHDFDYLNPSEIDRYSFEIFGNDVGWEWMKDAAELTLTPYIATFAGPKLDGSSGLARYQALDPIAVRTEKAEPDELEAFMEGFEPSYQINDINGMFDSDNPYVKPIRMMQRTASGAVILLDKVLVTENSLTASFLIGNYTGNDDFQLPSDFQIQGMEIHIDPWLPYPEDYVHPNFGGGGSAGSLATIVNETPLVGVDLVSAELMSSTEYVSAKDPIQVRIAINGYRVCWAEDPEEPYMDQECFQESGNWVFEFETDGAELAELTQEFEVDEAFETNESVITVERVRFNPLETIVFIDDTVGSGLSWKSDAELFIEADDGTALRLWYHSVPFTGFSRRTVDPDVIAAFEAAKTLRLVACETPELPEGEYPEWKDEIDCDPLWETTIALD